jgi:hypothetical protein
MKGGYSVTGKSKLICMQFKKDEGEAERAAIATMRTISVKQERVFQASWPFVLPCGHFCDRLWYFGFRPSFGLRPSVFGLRAVTVCVHSLL